MSEEKTKSGVKKEDRVSIRESLKEFVSEKSKQLGYPEEAIVQEIRY